MDGYRIDEMQLLATLALRRQQVCFLENGEMLRHRLAAHVEPAAQLTQRLAVLPPQAVQEPPAAWIRESAEDRVVIVHLRQYATLRLPVKGIPSPPDRHRSVARRSAAPSDCARA